MELMLKAKKDAAPRILVAEDEEPIARALQLKLTRSGYKTAVASTGEEALRLCEQEKFDLIVLDLVLPKIDGFAILKKLSEARSQTPVVVISNLGQEDDIRRAKALGARDYFVKSDTSIANVAERIGKILNAK